MKTLVTTAEARLVMIIRKTREIIIDTEVSGFFPLFCIETESKHQQEVARRLEREEGHKKNTRPQEPQVVMSLAPEEETLIKALRIIRAHRPQEDKVSHLTKRYFYIAMELYIIQTGVDHNAYCKADLSYLNLDIEP